uniref:Fic/DOC family protein n=1 Tax=Nitrospira cf. moscoviensis SBR1015 TaxID=96242 RepID=UPI000A3BEF41|nr:Fic family protein [Nitrospira cf. moscoviensis SBR1015]
MSRYSSHDEYVDPATGVLKNRLGITDEATLETTEAQFVAQRSHELVQDPLPGTFDLHHLQAIHRHLFGDLYEWAGQLRTVDLTKDTSRFAHHAHLERAAAPIFQELAQENHLRGLEPAAFSERAAHYLAELNALHPFREGNGRAHREFLSQLARDTQYAIAWEQITQADMLDASRRSFSGDLAPLTTLIQHHLHRDVPLQAQPSAQASRSTKAAPPLTPPSNAMLRHLAEQERKRLQVIRTPIVRRFEARDEGMVQFGSVEQIESRYFALLHRQDETMVLSIDEATFKQLASVKRGHSIRVSSTGTLSLGRGRRR